MGSSLRLRLQVPVPTEHVQRLCTSLEERLTAGDVTAVVCHVVGAGCDLTTVDAVARLALVARRAGVAFSLDGPGHELLSLLGLVGLQALVRLPDGR